MLWQNINYCLVKSIFVIGRIIYCWCLKVLYCQFKNIIIIDMSKLLQLLLLANWHFLHKSIFMILFLARLYEYIYIYNASDVILVSTLFIMWNVSIYEELIHFHEFNGGVVYVHLQTNSYIELIFLIFNKRVSLVYETGSWHFHNVCSSNMCRNLIKLDEWICSKKHLLQSMVSWLIHSSISMSLVLS